MDVSAVTKATLACPAVGNLKLAAADKLAVVAAAAVADRLLAALAALAQAAGHNKGQRRSKGDCNTSQHRAGHPQQAALASLAAITCMVVRS